MKKWPDPLEYLDAEDVAESRYQSDLAGRWGGQFPRNAQRYTIQGGFTESGEQIFGDIRPGPYVLAWLPLEHIEFQGAPWGLEPQVDEERLERAIRYAERLERTDGTPPPGYCLFSQRAMRKGLLPYVIDGNHRALAAFLAGRTHVLMMVPAADYQRMRDTF